MPWFIDIDNLKIKISSTENSPFYFYDAVYTSKRATTQIIDPQMLFFQFKRKGPHMKDQEYGKIKRKQPLYNMEFEADKETIQSIKEFYVNN